MVFWYILSSRKNYLVKPTKMHGDFLSGSYSQEGYIQDKYKYSVYIQIINIQSENIT